MSKGATRPVTTLRWLRLWRAVDWFLNKLRSRKMRWHLFGRWCSERTIVIEHDRFFKSKFQRNVSATWAHNGHMHRVVANCSDTITQLSTILCQNCVYCVNYELIEQPGVVVVVGGPQKLRWVWPDTDTNLTSWRRKCTSAIQLQSTINLLF